MAVPTCYNCIYACCDPELWLRSAYWASRSWLGVRITRAGRARCTTFPACPAGTTARSLRSPRAACVRSCSAMAYTPMWTPPTTSGSINGAGVDGGGYAVRYEKGKMIYMHREIMQPPEGMIVDHKSRNKLDNSRDNLRVCTREENMRNRAKAIRCSSRFKGVLLQQDRGQVGRDDQAQRQADLAGLLRRRGGSGPRLRPQGGRAVRRIRQAELPGRMAAGAKGRSVCEESLKCEVSSVKWCQEGHLAGESGSR